MWVTTLHYLLCNQTHPYPVTLLPIGSGYFRAKPSPLWINQQFSNLVILLYPAYEDGTEYSETSAYKIQTPGITQTKTCSIGFVFSQQCLATRNFRTEECDLFFFVRKAT